MLTDKEVEEMRPYWDSLTLEDLDTPEIPTIELPKELKPIVEETILRHIKILEPLKNDQIRIIVYDVYSMLVRYLNRLKPVFTNKSMIPIWCDLFNKSPEKAKGFADFLFRIENRYDYIVGLVYKHKCEIEDYQEVINLSEKLLDALIEYQAHYYGHMLQDSHNALTEMLEQFIKGSKSDLAKFIEHRSHPSSYHGAYAPLSRKRHGDKALAIFFMKLIYSFFQKHFKQPLYKYIGEIVLVIFGIPFNDNEIIKHCSNYPLKDEDSEP